MAEIPMDVSVTRASGIDKPAEVLADCAPEVMASGDFYVKSFTLAAGIELCAEILPASD